MSRPRHIAVFDLGKTNAKLALVDLERLSESHVTTRPNQVLPGPPYPHFDTEGLWAFLLAGLTAIQASVPIEGIAIATHGAAAALLDATGDLAAPVLDYEYPGPEAISATYERIRPGFAETGSPRLPAGLNLGAQLHWQFDRDPGLRARVARILPYPQFWAARLTGVMASDVSSLGCHTDLWNPWAGGFSSLVGRLGIADRMAPPGSPARVLGPVLPALAARLGLRGAVPVVAGIHDSNASLYPHLLARQPPFAVVSTGTWVVAMAVGGAAGAVSLAPAGAQGGAGDAAGAGTGGQVVAEAGAGITLDPARDTLVNVNALGQPLASARFMGGREYQLIGQGLRPATGLDEALASLLDGQRMLLPAVEPGSGPFAGRPAHWRGGEPAPGSALREAALSLYLAMMTAECLAMIGAAGPVIVEGPFARNQLLLRMLSAATARPVIAAPSATGTALGAALLLAAPGLRALPPDPAPLVETDAAMVRYAAAWRQAVAQG